MMDYLRRLGDHFRKLLSGKDNETPDPARWGWFIGHLGVLAVAGAAVWHGGAIDLVQLATALGIVNGVAAGATVATNVSQPVPPASTTVADSAGNAEIVATTGGGA